MATEHTKRRPAVRLLDCVRVVLGGIFLVAGLLHLSNPYFFFGSILDYRAVSVNASKWAAIVLPFVEIVVGGLLIGGIALRSAFVVSALLAIVFLFAQFSVLGGGRAVDCGCFGPGVSRQVGAGTLVFTTWIAVAACLGCRLCELSNREQPITSDGK